MNEKEIAYRNGYAKGYQDAKKEERHGRWLKVKVEAGDPFDGNSVYCFDVFACSECGCHFDVSEALNYCPNCGAIMDLPNITEQTENALRKLGEHREEVDFDYNAED
jgi:rubrerythrin